MSELVIRDATESDIDAVLDIERLSFSDPWCREAFCTNLREDCIFSLVCDGEKAVGYEILAVIPPEGELYNIAVHPDCKGLGYAQRLYFETESRAYQKGVRTVYLEVREGNLRARKFYEKLGFTNIGIRKNYYHQPTENAVLMSKNIEINGKK